MSGSDSQFATTGAALDDADAAMVLLHGRGSTAHSVLQLAAQFDTDGVVYVAPQAPGGAWYPNSFMAPIEANEPGLSNGLAAIDEAVFHLTEAGIPHNRIAFGGFSHGACLASEYVARNPRRWGGLVVFSGGVIGPDGMDLDYEGDLDGTPVFIGCSDVDPHIPVERVHETTQVLRALGGDVTERIYEGMAHTIVEDEMEHARALLSKLADQTD
ncbi:alpha/beta hydrolase [Haloarchaeobius sp. DFWS5]|uniref:alpha/beta hydrolase n=1 Tax=Haloarchaeobius sp. DFWS5 TaxID=3446114 RepID=UPI003EBBC1BB